ncbi:MAG: hypothetical protein Q8N65_00650 [bacterium]|nr:hypothetical protein [bacterium]
MKKLLFTFEHSEKAKIPLTFERSEKAKIPLILTGVVLFFVAGFFVFAQEADPLSQITYPVAELGDCQSREACESYCDQPENMAPCLDFAESHNLISPEELSLARKMLLVGETAGPGNCRGQAQCQAYCDDINNIEECLAFGEEHGLIPADELAEAQKVAAAIKRGVKPPNCRSKKECGVYCGQSENMEECLVFGEAAGLIPPEELGEARKVLAAVKKGAKLPGCRGKADCDVYCSQDEHFQECLDFAEAAGFMSPEEAIMVRKTGGKGPGGCRGKEVCEAFCEDPANAEACVDFAVQYGFMEAQEAEQAKKMMKLGIRGGPGGCKGREECEAFCDELSHLVECVDFAEKAGFMNSEEAVRARRMAELGIVGGPGGCKGKEECEAFCQNPENGQACVDFAVKAGDISPEEAERARQGMEMMQRQRSSGPEGFPEIPGQIPGQFPEGMTPPEGMRQPPTPEEMEKMEQEGQKRAREQVEQMIPGAGPVSPPEGGQSPLMPEGVPPVQISPVENPPQSFLERAQNFLADTLFLLRK